MEVELYYRWSKVDKQHEFSLRCEDDAYLTWIFFYLGTLSSHDKKWFMNIYPYYIRESKHIATYKVNDADLVARFIYKRIEKLINEKK
jgi:hypothetical protein